MFRVSRFRGDHVILLSGMLLAFLAYLPGLHGPFVFDDVVNILQNRALDIHSLSWNQLAQAALSSNAGPLQRPLSMLSFALNVYFGGLDAYAFKWVNLLIHLLNGVLVYSLLYRVMRVWRRQGAVADIPACDWLPPLVAAAWLVHPLNLTAVLYVVQRETSLCSLFILAGCNIYLYARERQLTGNSREPWLWLYAGTLAMLLLALASKETGVLLPVYLLMLEACVFRFRTAANGQARGLAVFFSVFLLLPLCLGLVWLFGVRHGAPLSYDGREFTLGERLLTEPRVLWLYIRWTLFPRLGDLGLYHDDIVISTGLWSPPTTAMAIAGLLLLAAAALASARRWPWFAFGVAWFFTGQLLESTVFPLEIAFEHRNYLADLGVLFALLGGMLLLRPRFSRTGLRVTLAGVLTLAYAGVTLARSYEWRNPLSLAGAEAANHPASPYATYGYGQQLANLVLAGRRELLPEAEAALAHAAALPGSGVIPAAALALLQGQVTTRTDPAIFSRMAARLRGHAISASDQQGLQALVECSGNGNCHFPPEALRPVFEAALANPTLAQNTEARANLLVMYGNYVSHGPRHDLEKSRELMQEAAALVPAEPQYRINVVLLDIALGDARRAQRDLQQVQLLNRLGHLDQSIAGLEARIAALPAPSATGH
ncbi:MAG: hypothetical protein KGJ56_08105 [Gammaproteobacteria bacterium]|nr:hypothetical protein [Gammaproteobacteria bacterium]